jgi:predicted dehydrogenase
MRGDLDLAALATAPLALEQFVERIPLEAEEGEPLRLEFESFLAAVRGEAPVAVSGEEGRDALSVALQIVSDIERTLPAPAGRSPLGARA